MPRAVIPGAGRRLPRSARTPTAPSWSVCCTTRGVRRVLHLLQSGRRVNLNGAIQILPDQSARIMSIMSQARILVQEQSRHCMTRTS